MPITANNGKLSTKYMSNLMVSQNLMRDIKLHVLCAVKNLFVRSFLPSTIRLPLCWSCFMIWLHIVIKLDTPLQNHISSIAKYCRALLNVSHFTKTLKRRCIPSRYHCRRNTFSFYIWNSFNLKCKQSNVKIYISSLTQPSKIQKVGNRF